MEVVLRPLTPTANCLEEVRGALVVRRIGAHHFCEAHPAEPGVEAAAAHAQRGAGRAGCACARRRQKAPQRRGRARWESYGPGCACRCARGRPDRYEAACAATQDACALSSRLAAHLTARVSHDNQQSHFPKPYNSCRLTSLHKDKMIANVTLEPHTLVLNLESLPLGQRMQAGLPAGEARR